MKQAYDRLEGCLLFQDFNGIDRTENHSRNVVQQQQQQQPKSRRIKYQRNAAEPIPEEERDKDAKSSYLTKTTLGYDLLAIALTAIQIAACFITDKVGPQLWQRFLFCEVSWTQCCLEPDPVL